MVMVVMMMVVVMMMMVVMVVMMMVMVMMILSHHNRVFFSRGGCVPLVLGAQNVLGVRNAVRTARQMNELVATR